MGDAAADNEAAFEHIEHMSLVIFSFFAHLGGVRVTTADAFALLPGTYVNDVIINFYAHYLRGPALNAEQMQGVLVLPSYVFKLILDKGPQGVISACRFIRWLRRPPPAPPTRLPAVAAHLPPGNSTAAEMSAGAAGAATSRSAAPLEGNRPTRHRCSNIVAADFGAPLGAVSGGRDPQNEKRRQGTDARAAAAAAAQTADGVRNVAAPGREVGTVRDVSDGISARRRASAAPGGCATSLLPSGSCCGAWSCRPAGPATAWRSACSPSLPTRLKRWWRSPPTRAWSPSFRGSIYLPLPFWVPTSRVGCR